MAQETKQPELKAPANALLSPVNIQPGYLFYGTKGIEFRSNKGGYIIVPWEQVEYVSLEIILNVYYRGIIIKIKPNQKVSAGQPDMSGRTLEFVGGKPKRALPILQEHLASDQIRHRLGVFARRKAKKS
ncbi:DUF956 domain-containing protein [Weissella viridescens]|uniref:DUF956 domain-containing protein n=1 Tax=Weissella viridescens TaxID=1629 RepID=UPI001745F1B6|nr:DUF956 domain-containing protein [Weissella viridescens]QOD85788.1 DUF956 domain-containing protein [Weissella viridescens]